MEKILSVITRYVAYLIAVFLGLWVGDLLIGLDFNPFTSWVTYVLPLVLILSDYLFVDKDKEG